MDFFINKNATLPVLKLELIRDGRNSYKNFYEKIQNANIYFTMTDVVTGVKRIAKRLTGTQLVYLDPNSEVTLDEEYYIIYQFTSNDTCVSGRYIANFEIDFLDGTGTLIVPIRETLYVNVLDGGIKK